MKEEKINSEKSENVKCSKEQEINDCSLNSENFSEEIKGNLKRRTVEQILNSVKADAKPFHYGAFHLLIQIGDIQLRLTRSQNTLKKKVEVK